MSLISNEDIEIKLLLEAVYLKYGYDFRDYSEATLKRRILHRFSLEQFGSISEMQHRLLVDVSFFERLILDLSINVTEMFRDASFYQTLRKEVVPFLRTYPFLKIWHAGCSTGEEVYSMAILLKEEGLYQQSQIYATDFNQVVIKKAKDGIFPLERLKQYTVNYQKAGCTRSFADYYTADYQFAVIDRSLKQNVIFADHNLVTDGVFGEMNLILCRNVLIYFNQKLQDRVLGLFYDSLCNGGFLCLGSQENVRFSKFSDHFEGVVNREKIYRKVSASGPCFRKRSTVAPSGLSTSSAPLTPVAV